MDIVKLRFKFAVFWDMTLHTVVDMY